MIIRLGVLDLSRGEYYQDCISTKICAACGAAARDMEHLRLYSGQDKPFNGQVARRIIPTVRLDDGNEYRTLDGEEPFVVPLVPGPAPQLLRVVGPDRIEPVHTLEVEVIDEADCTPSVHMHAPID